VKWSLFFAQEFTFSRTERYVVCPVTLSLACFCNKLDVMFSSCIHNCYTICGSFSVVRLYELSAHYIPQSFAFLCTDKIKLVLIYTRGGQNTASRLKVAGEKNSVQSSEILCSLNIGVLYQGVFLLHCGSKYNCSKNIHYVCVCVYIYIHTHIKKNWNLNESLVWGICSHIYYFQYFVCNLVWQSQVEIRFSSKSVLTPWDNESRV
jgi:hypothetical protein